MTKVSHHFIEVLGVLSCTVVLERKLGSEGRLDHNDEDEYVEDSDYENESESTLDPASQNSEVSSEHKGGQKLLSVLGGGSAAA